MATASDNGKTANPGEEPHEPRECMPCRGSGRVVSNLGGTPKDVSCPWCEGSGRKLTSVDAQAHWPDPPPQPPADSDPSTGDEESQARASDDSPQPEARSRSASAPSASKRGRTPDRA